ncbi:hypothetical protein BDZ94DRAFT_1315769 [Collybia nuda]|uniref:Uncharacterized protein n=1 Tax=Collybia nuda TaxID=64659 RepID=A0A9P6CCA8_9AGAR|nr:hypothetical protein BDZ94DRAFT_1315769 [Collybia nuda]
MFFNSSVISDLRFRQNIRVNDRRFCKKTSQPPTRHTSPLSNLFSPSIAAKAPRLFADFHSQAREAPSLNQEASMGDLYGPPEAVPRTARDKGKEKEAQPPEWFIPAATGPNALHLTFGRSKRSPLYPHMPIMTDFTSGSAPWKPSLEKPETEDVIEPPTKRKSPLHSHTHTRNGPQARPTPNSPSLIPLPPSGGTTPQLNSPRSQSTATKATSEPKSPVYPPLPPSVRTTPEHNSPSFTTTKSNSPILVPLPPSPEITSIPESSISPVASENLMPEYTSPSFLPLPPSQSMTPEINSSSATKASPQLSLPPSPRVTPEIDSSGTTKATPKTSSPIYPSLPPSLGTTPEPNPPNQQLDMDTDASF